MKDPPLWNQLKTFPFDQGNPELSFRRRLACDNDWSRDFAERAIDAYRRFLYLAATADDQATPSQCVDQVWHLLLTYTNSYWDKLCDGILGKKLHHDPGLGQAGEAEQHASWYRSTRERYAQEFGEEPPKDLWPEPGTTLSAPSAPSTWRWVDLEDSIVVHRSSLLLAALISVAVSVALWHISSIGLFRLTWLVPALGALACLAAALMPGRPLPIGIKK
jgi:hypothetical protein